MGLSTRATIGLSMEELTQTECLMEFWAYVYDEKYTRYELLKAASKVRGRPEPMPRTRLKQLRRQFINDHVMRHKFKMRDQCFLCSSDGSDGYFLVRHHLIPLSKWGSNRQINIVTLCCRCHARIHPWVSPSWTEWVKGERKYNVTTN